MIREPDRTADRCRKTVPEKALGRTDAAAALLTAARATYDELGATGWQRRLGVRSTAR